MLKTIAIVSALAAVAAATSLAYRLVNPGWVRYRQSESLLARGDIEGALAGYERAWAAGLKREAVFRRLIQAYLGLGRADALVRLTQDVAQAAPAAGAADAGGAIPEWKARWELARALSYAKRLDEAAAEYRKLLETKPDLAQARIELANILQWSGKPEEAFKELSAVPDRNLDEKSLLLKADLLVTLKQYEAAAEIYRQRLSRQKDDYETRVKLAEMLSWATNYDASIAEFQAALQARPDDIQTRRKYANVLIWAGRHDEAAAELRKTLDAAKPDQAAPRASP